MSGQVKKIDTDSRQLQLTTSTDNIRTDNDNVEFQITELGNDTREMENYEEYNDRCQVITHSTIKHLQKNKFQDRLYSRTLTVEIRLVCFKMPCSTTCVKHTQDMLCHTTITFCENTFFSYVTQSVFQKRNKTCIHYICYTFILSQRKVRLIGP